MLRGAFDSVGDRSPAEVEADYLALLGEAIETFGVETVTAESGVARETVQAIANGNFPTVTLEEAAAILATDPDRPATDAITAEARDMLLMGMSMAVLDVEALAAGIDGHLDPKEIQQKVEGRAPMTLEEYAMLHQHIEQEKR